MKPKYPVGTWIRFPQNGALTIAEVAYTTKEISGIKYHTDRGSTVEDSVLEARASRVHAPLDGSWMDGFGACRLCGGEIPHGHSNNCDILKLEDEIRKAKNRRKS